MNYFHTKPKEPLDPKVAAVRNALRDSDPFYSGMCPIEDYQRLLYYTEGDLHRRIDVLSAGSDELDALYRACKPAEFGRGGENVFDTSYRKAGKMDLYSFSTLFDPHRLGIYDQISKALLTQNDSAMDMELYKLNVYRTGYFFKAHKDTPRGQNMFGSLVVILPTAHEGGQFVLRQDKKEWTLDFASNVASAAKPSACQFIAFYGDLEHEVLPVTSGYRITLTYNLYRTPIHPGPGASSVLTPFHLRIKQALVELVNDTSKLRNGGYIGFGLVHEYVHMPGGDLLGPILGQLKGSDRALVDVCNALGLRYSIRLLYRELDVDDNELHLLTTKALDIDDEIGWEATARQYLEQGLHGLTMDEVEGITFRSEQPFVHEEEFLKPFHKNPITEVMEVTPMKSCVDIRSPIMTYGNEASLNYFYGTACMVVAVEPAASRPVLQV